ncbi:DNA polymerase III subunit chi [Azomonas macrocytogenes]|uniref:DNA polymerase-3 subunit chi n=1 Tax=Azomonas macrocytogenes TaxID=69962 RepID=A0A839SYZ8_AZOMA|nr:DNA polymerase III subunit chi [Azomonas macrocytogenes]MBB3101919.1 DNA polymerase-3 subunit chi [Azomonas macrocytogenes]
MTRVEFYVLPDADPTSRLHAACRLAAKAWQQDFRVFLRCQDEHQCKAVDELLWSYRAERFIPHNLHVENPRAPVVVGLDETPALSQGLLINLAPDLSNHISRFARIIEIVNQQPELLALCRENFRLYRRQGYDPQRVEL